MRRILPSDCPTMRSTPGNSFGPIAISATTPITTNSLHPMPNILKSTPPAVRQRTSLAAGLAQVPQLGRSLTRADLRVRARFRVGRIGGGRRRRVIDGLRIGLRRVVFRHALLKGLDAAGDVTHQVGN